MRAHIAGNRYECLSTVNDLIPERERPGNRDVRRSRSLLTSLLVGGVDVVAPGRTTVSQLQIRDEALDGRLG